MPDRDWVATRPCMALPEQFGGGTHWLSWHSQPGLLGPQTTGNQSCRELVD